MVCKVGGILIGWWLGLMPYWDLLPVMGLVDSPKWVNYYKLYLFSFLFNWDIPLLLPVSRRFTHRPNFCMCLLDSPSNSFLTNPSPHFEPNNSPISNRLPLDLPSTPFLAFFTSILPNPPKKRCFKFRMSWSVWRLL